MKILILSDDFPPRSFGGAGQSTYDLAYGLKMAGHEIYVITICQDKENEQWGCQYNGLIIFRIYANYHEKWRGYLSLYNPQTVSKVKKIINNLNPDIIHANNIHQFLSYHCLKIAKKTGKPVFFTARDVMSFSYGKLATRSYLEKMDHRVSWLDNWRLAKKRYNPLRNLIIKRYLRYVDIIFAVSGALQEALGVNGVANAIVSHTGIDPKEWEISEEKVNSFKGKHGLHNKKVIFLGGRISEAKGYGQVQGALSSVRKEVPEAILLIAGAGGLGWLEGDDLRAAYGAADVVVVPSICFDAFPRSNLEAMACKKPVVATCFGGSSEIIEDNVTGYIVNPLNVDLLAEKIIDLLKNREKARQFGEAGFQRIETQFSRAKQIQQTINYYFLSKND